MNSNIIGPFEYVTVLISIILGLGITQLLSSVADAFYYSKKVKFYPPHCIWVVIVLFLHIQDWFVLYEMKNYPVWKLPAFLFICLYPITLFSIAKLLFPPIAENERTDFKEFFLEAFPKIFYLFAVCILLSIAHNLYFLKAAFWQQLLLLAPAIIFLVVAVSKTHSSKAHYWLSVCFLMLIIIITATENNSWYIK